MVREGLRYDASKRSPDDRRSQDPSGAFVRRWVPELGRLPAKHLHTPWRAPPGVLSSAGVREGTRRSGLAGGVESTWVQPLGDALSSLR